MTKNSPNGSANRKTISMPINSRITGFIAESSIQRQHNKLRQLDDGRLRKRLPGIPSRLKTVSFTKTDRTWGATGTVGGPNRGAPLCGGKLAGG